MTNFTRRSLVAGALALPLLRIPLPVQAEAAPFEGAAEAPATVLSDYEAQYGIPYDIDFNRWGFRLWEPPAHAWKFAVQHARWERVFGEHHNAELWLRPAIFEDFRVWSPMYFPGAVFHSRSAYSAVVSTGFSDIRVSSVELYPQWSFFTF